MRLVFLGVLAAALAGCGDDNFKCGQISTINADVAATVTITGTWPAGTGLRPLMSLAPLEGEGEQVYAAASSTGSTASFTNIPAGQYLAEFRLQGCTDEYGGNPGVIFQPAGSGAIVVK